tara:strand:- start:1267 stop:2235 length:969 start_codon:yes stop_codon:yes gene_type:complete
MSFYYINSNISLENILDICEIENEFLDTGRFLSNFSRADIATASDLTFFTNPKYIVETNAEFIITNRKISNLISKSKKILISSNLDCDIARISNLFYRSKTISEISKLKNYNVGTNSYISKNSTINKGATIGDNFFLDDFSSIGFNCSVGNNVIVGKNVSIGNAIIGDNVYIGDGTKIGQDGFGFAYSKTNSPIKIFHIGRVIIQNDVNINANCTIDKGSFSDTVIGEKTFIDNLVHIAHNVVIGNNCIIAGQCGFAGSCKIGNFVQIGGQTGIGGHINISDNVKIAAKSGVIRDIDKGQTVMGYPAVNINKYLKNYKKMMA